MRTVVRPLEDVEQIVELATEAKREGHRFVSKLVTEWRDGSNRFDAPGERLFVAIVDDRVVGVGGLNRDPYTPGPAVGRVRRLYVAPTARRAGIASALVTRIINEARGRFERLRLRTFNPDAARFYEAMGFSRVNDETCTHQLLLG